VLTEYFVTKMVYTRSLGSRGRFFQAYFNDQQLNPF
jgi:hypothetical protein